VRTARKPLGKKEGRMTIAFSYKKLQPEIEIGLKNKLSKVSGKTKKQKIRFCLKYHKKREIQ